VGGQVPAKPAVTVGELRRVGDGDTCSCASLLGSTASGRPLALFRGAIEQVRHAQLAAWRPV
jgi:hypothetical protein